MVRVMFMVVCFVIAGARAGAISAQAGDFVGELQPTLPANELLLDQIRTAIPSTEIDALTLHTGESLGAAEDLQQQLSQALTLAPDDTARSRLEGVLTHTQAALDALRLVQAEDNLDVARGRLDQARGEAQESLDELRPLVLELAHLPTGK